MAGNRDFEIILKMRAEFAQAQAELKKTQGEIANVGKALDKANGLGAKSSAVFKGVGIAAAAASTAALAVLGAYIEKTIEGEKVQAQLQARLKDTGSVAGRTLEDLNAQAEKLQGLTVFDDETVGNAQAILLTFTQIRGVNFDRTIEQATNLATVMGIDVPDAAKILGKALSDPVAGLGALRKAGVTFTDAQTEQIKKMVEAGQIAEAQKAILDKLAGTMGSAATAARDTLGGALQALHNSVDDLLKGKAGDAGIVGARQAVEDLIRTLNDPATKQGFNNMISGIVQAIGKLVSFTTTVANTAAFVGQEVAARLHGPSVDDIVRIDDRIGRLKETIAAVKAGGFQVFNASELIPSDLVKPAAEVIKRLQSELDKEQNKLTIGVKLNAEATAAAAKIAKDANTSLANPAPEGEGVATGSNSNAKSTADADADIKRRIASLQQEAALLGAIGDGETKASEAAKARYDITEGEFKNKSPQLKQELLLAAEALDQKNADIEAEKKRKQAFDDTKEAYDQLVGDLRTPAEVALDKAIAEVNTLNKALEYGNQIVTTGGYNAALAKIASGLVDKQPDFQGLAPEVGGAFGELGKLDKAAAAEDQWYKDSLARLEAFRAEQAANNAAADVQEEQLEAQHQARMQQIEAARQQASLSIASDFFGQLAQLQHSQNSKIAAIGKAAAIAQALINTYQSATAAYAAMASIPYVGPALGIAAAAAAIAAGLANVAQIRAQPTGFAEGGYTGPGGKFQPAGIVHAGEGVLNQGEIAALGGPGGFYALRDAISDGSLRGMLYGWAGYADGGLVTPQVPQLASPDFASFPQGGAGLQGAQVNNALRVYLSMNQEQLIEQLASHPKFEKKVVAIAGENGKAITANW